MSKWLGNLIVLVVLSMVLFFLPDAHAQRATKQRAKDVSSPAMSGDHSAQRALPEIRDGALWENGRPVFLFGGMPPEALSSKIQGLNFIGLEADPGRIFAVGPQPVFDGKNMRARILRNLESKVYTNILWGHGFPQWAIDKWLELKGGTGFFHYNILAPRARDMNRTALELVLDKLRPDYPFSIDLANEPSFNGNVSGTGQDWQKWLQQQYLQIENLNRVWHAKYTRFEEVKVPDFVATEWSRPFECIKVPVPASGFPTYRDWAIFNRTRVSGYFAELAAIVRSKAPEIKLFVKVFPNAFFNIDRGISPVDITELTDFAGCDTWTQYPGTGDWAFAWQDTWMWLDMLRSVRPRKPVLNSENHLLGRAGQTKRFAPEEYFYAVFMGEAVHGQYATLIWARYPEGNVHDRPEAVRGMQRAFTDLQRLGDAITTLASVEPHVVLLYSTSTMLTNLAQLPQPDKNWLEHSPYLDKLRSVYEKLITSGIPVSFAFEERPLTNQVRAEDLLIIPGVTHIERTTLKQLSELAASGLKVIGYEAPLSADEHGQAVEPSEVFKQKNFLRAKNPQEIVDLVKASNGKPEVNLLEAGKEVNGIEWRCVRKGSDIYLFILNLTNQRKNIAVQAGRLYKAVNLIDEKTVQLDAIPLQPLDVRIIKMTST